MVNSMLNEIILTKLSEITVKGGNVLHAMKKNDVGYVGIEEVYFSFINFKTIKAWKLHKNMTLNLVVPYGKVRFVFCDPINPINYRVENIGFDNYYRITVPPGIWFGFKGLHAKSSIVANIANLKHDPNEVRRKDIAEFSYKW